MVAECLELLDARQAADDYARRGWQAVPLPPCSKAPTRAGWQRGGFTPADFDPAGNVGLLLGAPSRGLVDIDLDCPEAVELAPEHLPPTGWTFGREGKPRSHWLYIVEGDTGRTRRWKGEDGACLLELRGDGAQTMAPPSLHPDGERVRDDAGGEPTPTTWPELEAACEALADAVRAARGEAAALEPRPLYEYLLTPAADTTDRERRYADAALDGEVAKVRAAGEGGAQRHLERGRPEVGPLRRGRAAGRRPSTSGPAASGEGVWLVRA